MILIKPPKTPKPHASDFNSTNNGRQFSYGHIMFVHCELGEDATGGVKALPNAIFLLFIYCNALSQLDRASPISTCLA